jgi:hypothetical protein
MLEIAAAVVAILLVVIFVQVTPYLAASKKTGQIGVYNQKLFAQNTVALQQGQRASSQFNYTTYDPAILVIDMKFQNWERPGYLSVYCNGILLVSFLSSPSNPNVQLTTVTFSGYDLVKPPAVRIGVSLVFAYGNEIAFLSPGNNGYEGTFTYEISIRGSR